MWRIAFKKGCVVGINQFDHHHCISQGLLNAQGTIRPFVSVVVAKMEKGVYILRDTNLGTHGHIRKESA
jgi:hypothetical protein